MRTYLVTILLTALIAMVCATGYGFLWSSHQAREAAQTSMSFNADRAVAKINRAVGTARTTVSGLVEKPGMEQLFTQSEDCRLTAGGDETFGSVRIDVVTPAGDVVCSSEPGLVSRPGLHTSSSWLADSLGAKDTTVVWGARDEVTGESAVLVTAPVSAHGQVYGVVAVFMGVSGMGQALAEELGGARQADFTVVDTRDRSVVSSSDAAGSGSRFGSEKPSGEWTGAGQEPQIFGSAAVANSPWRVYSAVDTADVLARDRGGLVREALVLLLALLVLAAGLYVLSRRVSTPLRRLTDAVNAMAHDRGPHERSLSEEGAAEIAALAHQFNTMLDVRSAHVAQLTHLANHDALTGLPNTRLLRDQTDAALRHADEVPVALLFLGLDRFKVVNDALGHEAGDAILRLVAERFLAVLPEEHTLARFAGDEFVVLATGLERKEVLELAGRLMSCLSDPFPGGEEDVVLQASVGVTTCDTNATDSEQLVREAVAAMHHAKLIGQEVSVYDETLQVRAAYQIQVERDLRIALENDELVVHYQPLTNILSEKVVGVEALVRWLHPSRGMVPPLEFIPVAETSGQIKEIGHLVLSRACRQAVLWAEQGHLVRMSVNVAAAQLHQGDFPSVVAAVLEDSGLPADQLCLEITESSMMRSGTQMSRDLSRLRQLGVHLAIDDFGTGYSSLAYLHRLPVDEIKIDRSFISRLGIDPRVRHLVRAILAMAQALDLSVVAEGVETSEQLDYIREHGCDIAQGYLFSPPRAPEDILALLDARAAARP